MILYHLDAMLWPILGSATFIALIGVYLWRRRGDTDGALPLALTAFVLVLWCLAAAAEVAATDPAVQRRWFVIRDAFTLPGVVLAFWFAIAYAGLQRWVTRPLVAVLVAATAAHVLLSIVDGGRLLWSNIWLDGEVQGDRTTLGLLFGAFAVAMFLASTAVFLLLFVRSPAHRQPVAVILIGQVALRVLYPMVVFEIAYIPNIVAGVIGFDFVTAMYALALFRLRLFDLVPVARQTMFVRLPDPLLVLDPAGRIADLNEAAERLLEPPSRAVIGRPLATALAAFPGVAEGIGRSDPTAREVSFDRPTGARTYEVVSTPLSDWQGRPIGRLVLMHDITALRAVEAQLLERERVLAAVEERERMARELHDGLSQDLWLAKLKTCRLMALPDLPDEARVLTDEVTVALDAGLDDARDAVAAMRLTAEQGETLCQLLERRLEDFEDRFGLAVELDCPRELPAISPRAETEALRITQEALTNVRRHADATVVRVRAAVAGGLLVVEIRDNGRGFDPATTAKSAYGLAGMRERATLIGGDLQVESAPQRGTCVRLTIPVGASVVPAGTVEPELVAPDPIPASVS